MLNAFCHLGLIFKTFSVVSNIWTNKMCWTYKLKMRLGCSWASWFYAIYSQLNYIDHIGSFSSQIFTPLWLPPNVSLLWQLWITANKKKARGMIFKNFLFSLSDSSLSLGFINWTQHQIIYPMSAGMSFLD